MTTPFRRIRFVLRATRDVELPGMQGGLLYALLCNANRSPDGKSAYPSELFLDVPEQARTKLRKDEPFAFGGTWFAPEEQYARDSILRVRDGLAALGESGKPRAHGLGGNFQLESVTDLVSQSEMPADAALTPIPLAQIDGELKRLLGMDVLTLHFLSPTRIERLGKDKQPTESFYDDRCFDVRQFLKRLVGRMRTLGIQLRDPNAEIDWASSHLELLENRLVWLDVAYGGRHGKTLGGVVGKLRIHVGEPLLKAALAWGQYTRIGKNSSFGFGRYRIEELGPEPFACGRAMSLLESAWRDGRRDHWIDQAGLDAGVLAQAIETIRDLTYQPHPPRRIVIGAVGAERELQIPSRRDRVLQRLVLDAIAPALDQLFESSAFAWRKGMGRHSCARAISKAFRQGYRFFIRADVDRFFDSVDHQPLFDRLAAYVGDLETCALIRRWITAAMTGRTRGIPTGSPLSPVLGNLFLDQFDERIARRGGRLVRYGDDFMILFRQEQQAAELLQAAIAEVAQLELRLNDEDHGALELSEPFQFLGFQFQKTDRWHSGGDERPRRLEELGWFDASRQKPRPQFTIRLPGETGGPVSDLGLTAIVGPNATHLEIAGDQLLCHHAGGKRTTSAPINDLEWLIVLGSLGMSADVTRRLTAAQTSLLLADDRGFAESCISADFDYSPEIVAAQVDVSRDPLRCLVLARELVHAKLKNYAQLAQALPAGGALAEQLRTLAERSLAAERVDQLRGIEGAGAAAWFNQLSSHLGAGFHFTQRVAPQADDPINVLLNIAYTQLYRVATLAIRSAGLISSISCYHVSTERFQGLASDLMEPFRFLMDRVVIEASHRLRPRDFARTPDGVYPLTIKPETARQFQLSIWQALQSGVRSSDDAEAVSYLMQIQRQARRFRRSLVERRESFRGFHLS